MWKTISLDKSCSSFFLHHPWQSGSSRLVLSKLDLCLVFWSETAKKQSREARYAHGCMVRANINGTHDRLGWLKVNKRLKISILHFLKYIYLVWIGSSHLGVFTLAHPQTCKLVLNTQLQKINSTSARKWCRRATVQWKVKLRVRLTSQNRWSNASFGVRTDNVTIFSKVSSFIVFLCGGWCCSYFSYVRFMHLV